MTNTPRNSNASASNSRRWWRFVQGANWRQPEGPGSSIAGKDEEPVVDVSFADAKAYAVTSFARDMLAVAETLRRAVASLPADGFDNVRAGIEATERELLAIFGRQGISKIEITPGEPLDPNRHQAMLEVESDMDAGSVVAELASGWTIRDRLLRPAMVSVARAG